MSVAPKFKTLGKPGFRLSAVIARLRSLGLSKEHAYLYHKKVQIWITSNGIEWTVSHLKSIKSVIMSHLRGHDHPGCWVATKNGFPSSLAFLSDYSDEVVLRVANFYKAIVFIDTTNAQRDKFLNAVHREQPDSAALEVAAGYITVGMGYYAHIGRDQSFADPKPIALPKKSVKTMPLSDGKVVPRTSEYFVKDLLVFLKGFHQQYVPFGPYNTGSLFWEHPAVVKCINWLGLKQIIDTQLVFANIDEYRKTPSRLIGAIGHTQEGGGKLRCFANPNVLVQSALEPLYNALRMVALSDPCDFSLDQSLGHNKVLDLMKQNGDLFYYDLSNATDSFPLSLQVKWMEHYGWSKEQYVLFQWCSRQNWASKFGILSWTVGQPLGLLPSFHAFGCTHSALIRGIEVSLYGEPKQLYAVVGDDVVIADANVASVYKSVMESLGVGTSDDKSSSGSNYVEFCGRIIHDGRLIQVGKAKALQPTSLLALGSMYGKPFLYELTKYLRGFNVPDPGGLARTIFQLPAPFGLDFGDGLSLKQRLRDPLAETWILSLLPRKQSVKKAISSVHRMIHLVREQFGHSVYQDLSPITGPRFISSHGEILENSDNEDRVFFSYPNSGLSLVTSSKQMKHLIDVVRGIIRDPVQVGQRIANAICSLSVKG